MPLLIVLLPRVEVSSWWIAVDSPLSDLNTPETLYASDVSAAEGGVRNRSTSRVTSTHPSVATTWYDAVCKDERVRRG